MKKYQLLVFVFFVAACGPMNKQFNKNTLHNDLKEIKETGVAEEDTLLLSYYFKNAQAAGLKIDSGATYKQLLETARTEKMKREIKDFIKEDSVNTASNKEKAKAAELSKIVGVAFLSIAVTTTDQESEITILLNIQNNGAKIIKAFKGVMTFYDLFGTVVNKYELKYNLPVNPKEVKAYYFRTKYNDKNEQDAALAALDDDSLRFVFEPQQILFSDGTEMNL